MALEYKNGSKFCFCTFGNNSTWHSDLDLPMIHGFFVHDYTLTMYNSKLVVIGGTLLGHPIDQVLSLSSMENEWKHLPKMLTARSSVAAVGYGDHLVAAGGKCGDKVCHEVEVFDRNKWTKVKPFPYPKSLNELTSVLHTDKKWYIMESNGGAVRATYSAPIEDIISDSSAYEWKEHSPEACPPSGILPPISFEGQLVVVGNNGDYKRANLYFCSPDGSWVNFENAGQYCKIVGITSLLHRRALILLYDGSEPRKGYTVKVITHKGNCTFIMIA